MVGVLVRVLRFLDIAIEIRILFIDNFMILYTKVRLFVSLLFAVNIPNHIPNVVQLLFFPDGSIYLLQRR